MSSGIVLHLVRLLRDTPQPSAEADRILFEINYALGQRIRNRASVPPPSPSP